MVRSGRSKDARELARPALLSALSAKARSGDVIVVDKLEMDNIKTKQFAGFLGAVSAGKALVVTPEVRENVVKSARNIPGVKTTIAGILSPYDIMNYNKFIVDEAALRKIEEVYA